MATQLMTVTNGRHSEEYGTTRPNRLERFEESLKRVNPPAWMKDGSGSGDGGMRVRTRYHSTSPSPHNGDGGDGKKNGGGRARYSDYRRAYSTNVHHRHSGSSQWKYEYAGQHHYRPNSASLSREPSPSPYGPTARGFQGGPPTSSFGRWSTSTLCDSAYSGNNTPTDSVVSGRSNFSNKSLVDRANNLSNSKPYTGWRSQDNLTERRGATPTERLAYSLRHGRLSSGDSSRSVGSCDSVSGWRANVNVPLGYTHSLPRNSASEQLVHDSIRSISSAIMEFCKAEEVPLPPPDAETRQRRHRSKEHQQRARVVWLESSFVSAAGSTSSKSK